MQLIHHLYVTDTRGIDAIKYEIVESPTEFLMQRFLSQEDGICLLRPLVNLQQSANLKECSVVLILIQLVKVPMQRKFQSIANSMKVTFEPVSFDVESFKGIS
jgi:hypothetical protein